MSLPIREVTRRSCLVAGAALAACSRKPKQSPYIGRWEGKLSNGASSLGMQFDFSPQAEERLELRVTARDLFFSSLVLPQWKIEGNAFSARLPFVEGERSFTGYFSGPTFDLESKPTDEKIHVRQLGRVPALPYKETGANELTPTNRTTRATVRLFGASNVLKHFHADLLARMGVETTESEKDGAGWFLVEDQPLPAWPKEPPKFLMLRSPSRERLPAIANFEGPIFVLLGEADERFQGLERGTRQVAFELREALTKRGRKMDSFQISVVPQADQTVRVRGFGKEYPRVGTNYLEHFRRFLTRFDTTV